MFLPNPSATVIKYLRHEGTCYIHLGPFISSVDVFAHGRLLLLVFFFIVLVCYIWPVPSALPLLQAVIFPLLPATSHVRWKHMSYVFIGSLSTFRIYLKNLYISWMLLEYGDLKILKYLLLSLDVFCEYYTHTAWWNIPFFTDRKL